MPHRKVHLPYVEFYITNVCNFNCQGCNRFNNYAFTGRQRWKDHEEAYRAWSQILDFDKCSILGGEPMTSPDLKDWIQGILSFWPQRQIHVITNGSLLDCQDQELYELYRCHSANLVLDIGLHDRSRLNDVMHTVQNWLVSPLEISRFPEDIDLIEGFDDSWNTSYQRIRDASWPDCAYNDWMSLPDWIRIECETVHGFGPQAHKDTMQHYRIKDANGVTVNISWECYFHQGALIANHDTGHFSLHQSDPIRAHDVCHSKKCHHFESGQLYKCGQVSLFPQFYQQFHLDVSESDRHLMFTYQPAHLGMDNEELESWVENLNQPMAQCKFCPESYHITEIRATRKKMHFPKKLDRKNNNVGTGS